MSETLKLTEFCKHVETYFSNYQLTVSNDDNGDIYLIEIHSNNDIFTTAFLRFMFDKLKSYCIIFTNDSYGRPLVQIID